MKLEADRLKTLVRSVMTSHPDEIGCERCLEELDRFVEMKLAGKDPSSAMPLVRDHLANCRDCRAEFSALLAIVQELG